MKPCWEERGLTEAGARVAEATIDPMMAVVRDVLARSGARITPRNGKRLGELIFAEALFRVYELPLRTKDFQKRHKETNG